MNLFHVVSSLRVTLACAADLLQLHRVSEGMAGRSGLPFFPQQQQHLAECVPALSAPKALRSWRISSCCSSDATASTAGPCLHLVLRKR